MPRTTLTPDGRDLVHHSRCGGVFGPVCRCPASWPRLKEDTLIAHRWNGNCLAGDTRSQVVRLPDSSMLDIVCGIHGEPRGSCTHCQPCGGCEAGKRAQEAMVVPYPVCGCGHRYDRHRGHGDPRGLAACYECPCLEYDPHARPLNKCE